MEVPSATEAATWWEGPSWRKLRARIGVRPEVRLDELPGALRHRGAFYRRARRSQARAAADAIERALGETFATPSVDHALTGTDGVVVAIKPKRR